MFAFFSKLSSLTKYCNCVFDHLGFRIQVNGAELRGCKIKYSDSSKGFGIFSSNEVSDGNPASSFTHKLLGFCLSMLLLILLSENFEFECQIVYSLRTIWKNKPKHSISMGFGLEEPYQLVLQLNLGQFDQICLII